MELLKRYSKGKPIFYLFIYLFCLFKLLFNVRVQANPEEQGW